MSSIQVIVKHQGTKYDIELDPEANGETFKLQLYSLTNVEPNRQKILIKGGQLKDDTPLASLNAKPGQIFMMMGTPSSDSAANLGRPTERVKFLEDMTEEEAAQLAGALPAGLQNLGNTCYFNSALQTLKSIPELNDALVKYPDKSVTDAPTSGMSSLLLRDLGLGDSSVFGNSSLDLTCQLRDLSKQMSRTQESFPPLALLSTFRRIFPQFAQKAKDGHGYAQQDAEEAWSTMIQTLRQNMKGEASSSAVLENQLGDSWVDKYMAGSFNQKMTCSDPESKEESTTSQSIFFKLDCNIRGDTNHMREGIEIALNETIDKQSTSLGREATYNKVSKISRLPRYLPVHFVRFFWRKDTQKKAKVMRKVTFPMEFDIVEFCTDELKKKIIPIRDQIREIRKEEEDVERAKKRQKRMQKEQDEEKALGISSEPIAKKSEKGKEKDKTGIEKDMEMSGTETFKSDAEIEAERAEKIRNMRKDLLAVVDSDLAKDETSNQTGLYELRGVITHQGSSADSGHYTSYIKKQAMKKPDGTFAEEDGNWWWFNDDKVSEVDSEKIQSLCGGGESHSALILLYRAVPLPTKESVDVDMKES